MKKIASLLAMTAFAASTVHASVYEIDASHTTIGFSVKHMVVANVKGSFGKFEGTINFDAAQPQAMTAAATIDVSSVDTGNEKRDAHLLESDFFDATAFPQIFFETTAVEGTLPNLVLVGNLSMKGVTKQIRLPVEFNGPITDPWGNERIGMSGSTDINRQDFGITWSNKLDNGGLVVADIVRLIVEIEAIKK